MHSNKKEHIKKIMSDAFIHPKAIENFCFWLDELSHNRRQSLCFDSVGHIPPKLLFQYEALKTTQRPSVPCAILKLNGGLGTSMGCTGPKSALQVKEQLTFLDIIATSLANSHYSQTPLCFMNSFNTSKQTESLLERYKSDLDIRFFLQNKVPRLLADSLEPCSFSQSHNNWNPPGHGDVYFALDQSGILNEWLSQGIEYCFISNADNLGARFDPNIPAMMQEKQIDFLLECTKKTPLDKKGGSPCLIDNQLALLEIAQVEESDKETFYDFDRFPYFNTNNIWIYLPRLKQLIDDKRLKTNLIVNHKQILGKAIVQLESAMGSAISSFDHSGILVVDRSRFLPVKTTRDLLYLRSTAVKWDGKKLYTEQKVPTHIELSEEYSHIDALNKHFPHPLVLDEAISLNISGPFSFGQNVSFSGNNIFQNPSQTKIHINDHSHYHDTKL